MQSWIRLAGWGVALSGVLALAIFFRVYDLQNYPPGLFPDQAANGEDALLILEGDLRPFYPRGNGREALFFYLQAASIWLFGIGVWQMFLASAVVGVLTVLAVYLATEVWFGRLAGLMAAFLLAHNHWHVTLSRTGFRAILIPFFIALFTFFVGATLKAKKQNAVWGAQLSAVLAGAALAGGFYTYIAFRVMLGVVGAMVVMYLLLMWRSGDWRGYIRRWWQEAVLFLIGFSVVLCPLVVYFVYHPEAIIGRAEQVSVWNPDLQQPGGVWPTIWWSTKKTVVSFMGGEGDQNWRHNVAGFPLINLLVRSGLVMGLLWTLWHTVLVFKKLWQGKVRLKQFISLYLVFLTAAMMLPVITTAEGIPHGLRSIGLVVPVFVMAGVGLAFMLKWCLTRLPIFSRSLMVGAVAACCVLSVVYSGMLYFWIAGQEPEAAYAYRGDLPRVASWLRDYHTDYPDRPRPYLVLDAFSVQTVHFLMSVRAHDYTDHPDEDEHLYSLLVPETSHEIVLGEGEIIIFTQSTLPDADRYFTVHSSSFGERLKLIKSERNRFGQEIMRVYGVVPAGVEVVPENSFLDA